MPRIAAHLQRESIIEKYFKEQCELYGAIIRKKAAAQRGWPDREIYWFGGIHDVVELKRPKGGVFEPLQLSTHRKLRQRGHNVFVINTKELVDEYILSRKEYWNPYLQDEHIPVRRVAPAKRAIPLRQARSENDRGVGAATERGSPRLPTARKSGT